MNEWPSHLRHVRDLWSAAQEGSHGLSVSEMDTGVMVVEERVHDIDGDIWRIPGHIGIVSVYESGDIRFIHASTAHQKVAEVPMQPVRDILGAFSLQR